MNAVLAGAWSELYDTYLELTALVEQIDEEAANWRPPAPGTNSIAVLVRHAVGSNGMWLSVALDEPFERDREAEFRVHESPDTLVRGLNDSRRALQGRFERLDAVDPSVERHVQRPIDGEEIARTAGWCVSHVLSHTAEHWGQIQLTRDLYRAQA